MFRTNIDAFKVSEEFQNKTEEATFSPKLIHFIWSRNPIKEKYINNIMNFSKNRDFTIILWTDQNISSDVFNNTRNIEIRDLSRYCILTTIRVNQF